MLTMQQDNEEAQAAMAAIALQDGELRMIPTGMIHAAAHGNPNKMRADQFAQLKASMEKFGFAQPITVRVDDNGLGFEIVDGHHRWEAAQELGMEEIPSRVVHLNSGEGRVAAVALNRVRGNLDLAEVGSVFSEVLEGWAGNFPGTADLTVAGFTTDEIDDVLRLAAEDADPTATALAGGDTSMPEDDDEEEAPPKPFLLEIEFGNRKEYQAARRALRRAAGKGKDLAVGLMNVLGLER